MSPNNAINDDNSSNLTPFWLCLWKLSRIRIEIKTSIGHFREKGGYIMKEEMQKKLFCKIVLVIFLWQNVLLKEKSSDILIETVASHLSEIEADFKVIFYLQK